MQSGRWGDSVARILREENQETFDAAKKAIVERMLLSVVDDVLDELHHDADLVEVTLQYLLDTKPELLDGFVEQVRKRLIEDVARRSLHGIADATATAQQARALIKDDNGPVLRAVEELKRRLMYEIARRSLEDVTDAQTVARQAQALITKEHESLLQAVDLLKEQLLRSIVQDSITQLHDEMEMVTTPLSEPRLPSETPPDAFMTRPRVLKLRSAERPPARGIPDSPSAAAPHGS